MFIEPDVLESFRCTSARPVSGLGVVFLAQAGHLQRLDHAQLLFRRWVTRHGAGAASTA